MQSTEPELTQRLKREAALRALEDLDDGMVLGLGSGSTAEIFLAELAARVGNGLRVSGRGESHPSALSELRMNLSAHAAPIVQPSGRTPSLQWAKSVGSRRATRAIHRLARRVWPYNRLYFLLAQRTR